MPLVAGETKVCPVCDSVIDADARRCTECNTDLSLFDVSPGGLPDETKDPGAKDGKSIDDILDRPGPIDQIVDQFLFGSQFLPHITLRRQYSCRFLFRAKGFSEDQVRGKDFLFNLGPFIHHPEDTQ